MWHKAVCSAGWCSVFLAYTPHGVALVGAMCGPVVCDPESHAFVGVSRLSSNAAELNAMMFAVRGISVAVQLEKEVLPRLDVSFVSDNRYALGIMQFQTRANHAQAQLPRQWSWAVRAVLPNKYRHVRAHTGVAGNAFADVGVESGRRQHCTSLSWLWEGHSLKKEGVPFSLNDALWWTDQLGKPDPLTDQDGVRPFANCGLELGVGSANIRTLSPATDEPEVHFIRRRRLADAFSKAHRCCGFARDEQAQLDFSCSWWFSHGHLGCRVWAGRSGNWGSEVFV